MSAAPVLWLDAVGAGDVPRVGGKNASLGEMISTLAEAGVGVPPGFATTAEAYQDYVAANGIAPAMRQCLAALKRGEASLQDTGAAIRRLFLEGDFPAATAEAIRQAYRGLGRRLGPPTRPSRCAAEPRPRTCRMPASPASRRPS